MSASAGCYHPSEEVAVHSTCSGYRQCVNPTQFSRLAGLRLNSVLPGNLMTSVANVLPVR
jgi:hypothetical protein